MASNLELVRSRLSMRERLIVALDVDNLEHVKHLVQLLAPEVGMFKVGKQLFTCAGPQAVRVIQQIGGEVFLDLKFHDIPNTVAKAAVEATRERRRSHPSTWPRWEHWIQKAVIGARPSR